MLNEPASSFDQDRTQPRRQDTLQVTEDDARYREIRAAVETVLMVDREDFQITGQNLPRNEDTLLLPRTSQLLVTYQGSLLLDSEAAYAHLDTLFRPLNLLPIFRQSRSQEEDLSNGLSPHVIHVVQGRTRPLSGGRWLSLILFVLTVFSVLFVGMGTAINELGFEDPARADAILDSITENPERILGELWRGWPYAVTILLILGGHEMGHYIMARRNRTAASLPYFLPFPFGPFGTFGAAIRLREPMRNRKVLLDIGVAGPLVGMLFAVPVLLIGLATSPVDEVTSGLVEGNSILYALAKILVFGRFLPDGEVDVYVNQLAWAGWTGFLITGLNLIPVGQLDGGHVLYALLGRGAKQLFLPIVGALLLLTLFIANELFIFVVLIMLMGNYHAVPLDDITPLDRQRRNVAMFALVLFLLVFVPMPLTQVSVENTGSNPALPPGNFVMLPALFVVLRQRLTKR